MGLVHSINRCHRNRSRSIRCVQQTLSKDMLVESASHLRRSTITTTITVTTTLTLTIYYYYYYSYSYSYSYSYYYYYLSTLRVHVPDNWALGFWVIVLIVQVLGKYMMIRHLDP